MKKILFGVFAFLILVSAMPDKKMKIWLCGDSTIAIKQTNTYPETGWGMPFIYFWDSTIQVNNLAKNGRSTKTFINENLWKQVVDGASEGDYVFIQFGHNDESEEKKDRYTTPDEFKANLTKFVKEARALKAIPILLTPVSRRKFDTLGTALETHKIYSALTKEVADKEKVLFIDLDAKSRALYQSFGKENSTLLFVQLKPGEHPNYPEGRIDNTHFSELGARLIAQLVLKELKELNTDLNNHIIDPKAKQYDYVVAKDNSSVHHSIQEVLNLIPSGNIKPVRIFIKNGVYQEVVTVDASKSNIILVGESEDNTIIKYDNHSGMRDANGDTLNTWTCASAFIYGNDFQAQHITFSNQAGFNAGQAVALRVEGNRASFFNCKMLGFQDVLFLSGNGVKHYFQDCYIEGTTDFIFGAATALFDNCLIHSKKNSHVTAASTNSIIPYGFVFKNCKLTGDSSLNKVSLGRPWSPTASVTYINCWLGKHIVEEGWNNWKNPANEATARYSEYNSTGPGANPTKRVSWSKQLTAEQAADLTISKIFGTWQPARK